MNSKGFTLIEVLAVITVLLLVSLIITSNMYSSIDNNKKEQYILDAKQYINKAKYRYNLNKYKDLFINNGNCSYISIKNLGYKSKYNYNDNSMVSICLEEDTYKYYILLLPKDNGYGVYGNNYSYVLEDNLSIDYVN